MSTREMPDVLRRILAVKAEEVAALQKGTSLPELEARAAAGPPVRDFLAGLKGARGVAVIAEIKRRSPSAGALAAEVSAADRAREYRQGGAAALSVLCDREFFGGSLADLAAAREAAGLPVLCKDFIIDPAQVLAARAAGADAALLIAAALEPARLAELYAAITALGMTALIEVHQADELDPVLALAPPLVGINNRDLRTFKVDIATSLELRKLIPAQTLVVAESGIQGPGDVRRLQAGGLGAFLVGTSLMTAGAPAQALAALVAAGGAEAV